jgi:hypothetical protein
LPGFTLLRPWLDDPDGEDFVQKLPIIAWSIDPFSEDYATTPITVDGIPSGTDDWAVMQPDGVAIRHGDRSWPNFESWLDDMKEKARKTKQTSAA